MSAVAEQTRPGHALYNVGVTLRLVDHVLGELGEGAGSPELELTHEQVVDRVAGALILVERLEEAPSPIAQGARTRLRAELQRLLVDLHRTDEA